MDLSIFICMLFALQFLYWLIARFSAKEVETEVDYFLASKSVSFFPLTMTFIGVMVGGGIVLGAAEEAYQYGFVVYLYPLGTVLGMLLLGLGVGRRMAQFQVSTVAQIFEVVYASSWLKKVASLLSMISLFMILVGQIIASSKFLVSLGLSSAPLFVIFWAIVIIYTVQGGLKAVISTDVVQASLFTVVLLGCFGYVWYVEPAVGLIAIPKIGDLSVATSKFTGWLLMPLCFMMIEQDIAQRCFAGRSAKVVSTAALTAGACTLIVSLIPVFFGQLAKAMQLEIPEGGSVLMSAIIATTGPLLSSLVGCAILAAVISTATALINAISSNLFSDFALAGNSSMARVRAITTLISLAAILFAFCFDSIVDILIQSYELSVCCLFISVSMALFKRQGNFLSALLSILGGGIGFICLRLYPIDFPKEILSILLSLVGFGCGEMIAYWQKGLQVKKSSAF